MKCNVNDMTVEEYSECRKQEQMAILMREQDRAQSQGGPNPAMMQQFMGGGEASGGGGGEFLGAAGPWVALAAAVVANETYQNKEGNRPDDFSEQVMDGLTGKSLQRDMEKYLGDGKLAKTLGRMGNPSGMYKNIKDSLKPWEWF